MTLKLESSILPHPMTDEEKRVWALGALTPKELNTIGDANYFLLARGSQLLSGCPDDTIPAEVEQILAREMMDTFPDWPSARNHLRENILLAQAAHGE